jgi:hypothetical protein
VAVKSREEDFTYAGVETEFTYSDVIIVSGRTEDVERLAEFRSTHRPLANPLDPSRPQASALKRS